MSRTTRGTFIHPKSSTGGGPAGSQRFPVPWTDRDYVADELVICETNPELDDGKQAGTFFAPVAIKKGDPRPGAPGSAWKDFSLGRWEQITFRVGNSRVRINAGRDSTVAFIKIEKDITSGVASAILLDIGDIPDSAGKKVVKLRETFACDEATATPRRCMVLRSDYYD